MDRRKDQILKVLEALRRKDCGPEYALADIERIVNWEFLTRLAGCVQRSPQIDRPWGLSDKRDAKVLAKLILPPEPVPVTGRKTISLPLVFDVERAGPGGRIGSVRVQNPIDQSWTTLWTNESDE